MKLDISQANLDQALNVVKKATSGKSPIPILGHVLVRCLEDGWLMVQAYNLEMGLTYLTPAKIYDMGETTLPAKTFCDLVDTFKRTDVLTLTLDETIQKTEIKCGRRKNNLKGVTAQEFPVVRMEGENLLTLTVPEFRRLCQVSTATVEEKSRPVMAGVHFKANGSFRAEAVDGFRAMIITNAMVPGKQFEFIILAKNLLEALKSLDEKEPVVISQHEGQLIITNGKFTFTGQLTEGTFADIDSITPRNVPFSAVLNKSEFISLLKNADIIARDAAHTVKFKVSKTDLGDFQAELKAVSAETGDTELVMDVAWTGDFEQDKTEFLIAFNAVYMKELVEAVTTDSVKLGFRSPTAPILITGTDDGDYTAVCMPMWTEQRKKVEAE